MKYEEFELIADAVTDETWERIKRLKRPIAVKKCIWYRLFKKCFGFLISKKNDIRKRVETPLSLDECTIGDVLAMVNDVQTLPYTACKLLLGLEPYEVKKERVEVVLGFSNFVQTELARILKIFESTKVEPDTDEKKAGVEDLGKTVGLFGMVDYISKRQGITLEEAEKMKWKTVVALMIIDKENAEYNRRLMQVRSMKYKK